jgi:RNA polymerase sigma-70 factor (ECF subfamily)
MSTGAASERELLRSSRGGDQYAFAALVLIHSDLVFGALRCLGLDAGDAEEVTQDVFVRAWRGLARFEEYAQFSTWLYRIAFNEGQRRLSHRPPPRAEPDPDHRDRVVSIPEGEDLGPEGQALDQEFERILDQALAQLPPEWRAAVVLRDIDGLSTKEAAQVLGARQAGFKSCLHRGRTRLRALLEPYVNLEAG